MIHRVYKVYRIDRSGNQFVPGECILIDMHLVNAGHMPQFFPDPGTAEQWLRENGGRGLGPNHAIIEMVYWDYE